MAEPISRYPLQWPTGWKRIPDSQRTHGHFNTKERAAGASWSSSKAITMYQAIERLREELVRMGIVPDDVVISTNVPTRLDGFPRSDARAPQDPGAAVYWRDFGKDRCMAIDRYTKVEQNVAALAATIEAMRAIERHGGAAILDRAFTGFLQLSAPIVAGMKRPWQDVLGTMDAPVNRDWILARYRMLASQHHPDRGGDASKMAELNAARDEALKEIQQ